jgi:hypothetical protein
MYTTLEKVAARLSNYNDEFDTLIEDLISQVGSFIDSYCGRSLVSSTRTNEIYDGVNSNGSTRSKIFLRAFPVTTFTSCGYRLSKSPDTWQAYDSIDYDVNMESGILSLNGFSFPGERRNIRVTYTAGYLVDFAQEGDSDFHTLPHDVTIAATKMVVREMNLREKAGIRSEGSNGSNTSYSQDIDPDIIAILDKYRKIDFV